MTKRYLSGAVGGLEVLVVLVVVIVGSLFVMRVYQSNQSSNSTTQDIEITQPSEWIKYESKKHRISFLYPANWAIGTGDGAKGVNLPQIDKASYIYSVYDPNTSIETEIRVISKTFEEVVANEDATYASPDFAMNAELEDVNTTKTEFKFKGYDAVRFDTKAISAHPKGADLIINSNSPQEPVHFVVVYIDGNNKTYSVKFNPNYDEAFTKIYKSLEINQ